MVEVVLLLQKSATSLGWATGTSPHCYGSKKLLVHSNGHTPVHRVGSRTKLGEGSTQKVYVCDVVYLRLRHNVHEDSKNQESGKRYWAQWPATLNIHSTECIQKMNKSYK